MNGKPDSRYPGADHGPEQRLEKQPRQKPWRTQANNWTRNDGSRGSADQTKAKSGQDVLNYPIA